ncbi:MAG: hypothetical protein Q9166_001738 [cf. Caloplaca sp. 2 TL-2023]
MSEDQDLLARIGRLAENKSDPGTDRYPGHINLHKAQSPLPQTATHERASPTSLGQSIVRGSTSWRSPRPAPYQVPYGRGRGAYRPHRGNLSLVLNRRASESQVPQTSDPPAKNITTEPPQTAAAYVTSNGRHRQCINASVLAKVTEQRKRAIEESQHRKAQKNDQWERQRMHQYMLALDAKQDSSLAQGFTQVSSKAHEVMIDGLSFRVLKGGSKLARIYGEHLPKIPFHLAFNVPLSIGSADMSRSTPKRANIQGVTFVRSKQGNLYRSGIVRASK